TITDQLLDQAKATAAPKQKIAIAATFTAEPIQESLSFWMEKLGLPALVEFAGFNQVFQELLDPGSLLAKNSQGANVLLIRLDDSGDAREKIESSARDFVSAVKSAAAKMPAPLLILMCPVRPRTGNTLAAIERIIIDDLENLGGVYVVS